MKTNNRSVSVPIRLFNTPLMLETRCAQALLDAVNRTDGAPDLAAVFGAPDPDERAAVEAAGIAVIRVYGGLIYRGYGWYWRTTYQDIRNEFRAALTDDDVKAIVFDIDSPGGEVAGVFDLSNEIYKARKVKPIYAMANEAAYSAAYAIGSAAGDVFVSKTSGVGSVGVIALHVDASKMEEKIGLKYTPIFAGARKNDFSPHEPLSKEALEIGQKHVNQVYDLFVDTVARNRGMDPESVRDTQAAIFKGTEAVDAGLADGAMSWDELINQIRSQTLPKGGVFMNVQQQLEALINGADAGEVQTALAALGFVPKTEIPDPAETEKALSKARKAGADEALSRVKGVMDLCELAGTLPMAAGLIESGVSVEKARKKILTEKAEGGSEEIVSTVGPTSTGETNPLLADAQSRAEAAKEV